MNRLDKLPDEAAIKKAAVVSDHHPEHINMILLTYVNELIASGKARVMNDFVLIDELQPPLRGRVLIIELE